MRRCYITTKADLRKGVHLTRYGNGRPANLHMDTKHGMLFALRPKTKFSERPFGIGYKQSITSYKPYFDFSLVFNRWYPSEDHSLDKLGYQSRESFLAKYQMYRRLSQTGYFVLGKEDR